MDWFDQYRVLRGELSADLFMERAIKTPLFCADTGAKCKIYRHFKHLESDGKYHDSLRSAKSALNIATIEHTMKGGGDNGYIEGLFSIMRASVHTWFSPLGFVVRQPYRP